MANNEELWQACLENGELISDQGITKQQAGDGALHLAAHVWIWRKANDGIEILVQKRATDKRTWPGFFDISAAGHVDFMEPPLKTAIRETAEELGLHIRPSDIKLLFAHRADDTLENGIRENEFVWVYGCVIDDDHELKVDGDEVEDAMWLSESDLKRIVAGKTETKFVPHGDAYFNELFKETHRLTA
jgi:isopentenyl-diphosphate delta-isomerase